MIFYSLSVYDRPERKALEEKLVEEDDEDDEDDSRYLNLEGEEDGKRSQFIHSFVGTDGYQRTCGTKTLRTLKCWLQRHVVLPPPVADTLGSCHFLGRPLERNVRKTSGK